MEIIKQKEQTNLGPVFDKIQTKKLRSSFDEFSKEMTKEYKVVKDAAAIDLPAKKEDLT